MKWNAWYYFYGNRVSHGIIAYYIMLTDSITGFFDESLKAKTGHVDLMDMYGKMENKKLGGK